jgi:cellulose synthase/poly-beta-1,6-N-acetylglucosamine synthase-like glycosyltransferase
MTTRAVSNITGTLITLNEEHRIAEAIASLSFCDEIIVVDSGSKDRTREIAAACGARVIHRNWTGYSEQKNFAAEQAANDSSMPMSGSVSNWRMKLRAGRKPHRM